MQPENVSSIFVLGDNFEYISLKLAIHFAENNGSAVWMLSPKAFERVPQNVKPPDKEVLQLLTFMYLKDYKDLVSHLNSIHLWHKIPEVIILIGFEKYCNFISDEYKPSCAALVSTSLLDSAAVCSVKQNKQIILIVACQNLSSGKDTLQRIVDLYFPNTMEKTDDDCFLNQITQMFG